MYGFKWSKRIHKTQATIAQKAQDSNALTSVGIARRKPMASSTIKELMQSPQNVTLGGHNNRAHCLCPLLES